MANFGPTVYNIQIEEVQEGDIEDDPPPIVGCGIVEIFRQCCSPLPPIAESKPGIKNLVLTWYDVENKKRHSLPISSYQVYKGAAGYEASDQKIRLIFTAVGEQDKIKIYRSELPAEEI